MKKRILKVIAGLMCFKMSSHFSLLIGHFLVQPNEALLVLKDLQPSRADKASRPRLGISLKNRTGLAIFSKKKTQLGS